jgi:hypothetical protein
MHTIMNRWEIAAWWIVLIELWESCEMKISRVQSAIGHTLGKNNRTSCQYGDTRLRFNSTLSWKKNTYFMSDAAGFAIECRNSITKIWSQVGDQAPTSKRRRWLFRKPRNTTPNEFHIGSAETTYQHHWSVQVMPQTSSIPGSQWD